MGKANEDRITVLTPWRKLLSELLSDRSPRPANPTMEARNELEIEWAREASILRPADYESAALTN